MTQTRAPVPTSTDAQHAWLFGRDYERYRTTVEADDRDDSGSTRLGWINGFAKEVGWPVGEVLLTADGTLMFLEDASGATAVPLHLAGKANRSGSEGQGSLGGESASRLGEDRQVGVELDSIKPSNSKREE